MQKVVLCGAGFLGSHMAKALLGTGLESHMNVSRHVVLASRHPDNKLSTLKASLPISQQSCISSHTADVTQPSTLSEAFRDADVVVSLVGVMHGTPKEFEDIQWKGAENVARAARDVRAKLVHVSAIGADATSLIPYARTKGLGEAAVFDICPDATIIRPSLVFGPEDDFFNRFARLSSFLPFLPVFGGGLSRFQPVYADDIGRVVEIIARDNQDIRKAVDGKIIEAGGPEVYTYRELMEMVLKYTGRRRPILSLPFALGILQGSVLERLPTNLFTVTRAQVEQLKSDNIVAPNPPENHVSFKDLVEKHSPDPLASVHDILPTYLSR